MHGFTKWICTSSWLCKAGFWAGAALSHGGTPSSAKGVLTTRLICQSFARDSLILCRAASSQLLARDFRSLSRTCECGTGCTVEMHGSIRQLLCPVCGLVIAMNDFLSQQLRRRTTIPCTACSCPALRSRIMLYGDAEGELVATQTFASCHSMPSAGHAGCKVPWLHGMAVCLAGSF